MTTDAADAAAEVMVAFWRRSRPLDPRTRQLCGRLAAALDARGSLADEARADPYARTSPLAAALRRAGEGDPAVAELIRQLAPTPPDGEPTSAPGGSTQNVTVSGNGNFAVTAGRDLHLGAGSMTAAAVDVVLLIASDPSNLSRLRLGLEEREIREALWASPSRDRWTVDTWSSARLRDFTQALLRISPRIVHFSGHGSKAGGLVFEDLTGAAHRVPPRVLADLFAVLAETVECVVLNACSSEPQAQAIAACVPFVIGSPARIQDRSAIMFSVGFYQALGAGRTIPQAFKVGLAHLQSVDDSDDPPPELFERPR